MKHKQSPKKMTPVRGVVAPTVRPTAFAALVVAVGLSVPVFVVLSVVELLFLR